MDTRLPSITTPISPLFENQGKSTECTFRHKHCHKSCVYPGKDVQYSIPVCVRGPTEYIKRRKKRKKNLKLPVKCDARSTIPHQGRYLIGPGGDNP